MPLTLQSSSSGARTSEGGSALLLLALFVVPFRMAAHCFACPASLWGSQLNSGAPRFGKSNGNGLLGRAGAVLPFADMVKFFADKLPCLGGGCLSFALFFVRPF